MAKKPRPNALKKSRGKKKPVSTVSWKRPTATNEGKHAKNKWAW